MDSMCLDPWWVELPYTIHIHSLLSFGHFIDKHNLLYSLLFCTVLTMCCAYSHHLYRLALVLASANTNYCLTKWIKAGKAMTRKGTEHSVGHRLPDWQDWGYHNCRLPRKKGQTQVHTLISDIMYCLWFWHGTHYIEAKQRCFVRRGRTCARVRQSFCMMVEQHCFSDVWLRNSAMIVTRRSRKLSMTIPEGIFSISLSGLI